MAIAVARSYLNHLDDGRCNYELQVHRSCYSQEHSGRYAVVLIEWRKAPGLMTASNKEDFMLALRKYLGGVLLNILRSYECTESNLPPNLRVKYRKFHGPYAATQLQAWSEALALAVEMASALSGGRPAVLFVDDYDAPIFKAYSLNMIEHRPIFFPRLYSNTFALSEEMLAKVVIFGVQRLHNSYPFDPNSRLRYYGLGEEPFGTDFGFTAHNDLVHIHNNYNNDQIDTKRLSENFGGFPCPQSSVSGVQQTVLLSPPGVVRSFRIGHVDIMAGFDHVFLDLEMLPFKLISGYGLADLYHSLEKREPIKNIPTPRHLSLLPAAPPPDLASLVNYLRYEGLLVVTGSGTTAQPTNESARLFLLKYLQTWFDQRHEVGNIWMGLAESDHLATFTRRVHRAWNTRPYSNGRSAAHSSLLELFVRLLSNSIVLYGNAIGNFHYRFQSALPKLKLGEEIQMELLKSLQNIEMARFRTPEGYEILYIMAASSTDIDIPHATTLMEQGQKYYNHLKGQMIHSHDYPSITYAVTVIFCKDNPDPVIVTTLKPPPPQPVGDETVAESQ